MEQYQVSLESPIEVVGLHFMVSAWQLWLRDLPICPNFGYFMANGRPEYYWYFLIHILSLSGNCCDWWKCFASVLGLVLIEASRRWGHRTHLGLSFGTRTLTDQDCVTSWFIVKIIISDKQKPSLSTWVMSVPQVYPIEQKWVYG